MSEGRITTFRKLREWLLHFDWPAIVGSALVLAFCLLVFVPAVRLTDHEATNQKRGQNAEIDQQRFAPDSFWLRLGRSPVDLFTALLAAFSAILTATTFVQIRYVRRADEISRASADAARDSAEAAVAAQRPWLKFDIELSGDLQGGMDGLFLPIQFEIHNVGNNPATDVQVFVALVCGASGVNISDALGKLPQMSEYPGSIVFPNDEPHRATTAGVLSGHEVQLALASTPTNDRIAFGGVACVRYCFAGRFREGETIRAFLLYGKDGIFGAFDYRKLPIPMDSMILDNKSFYETAT